MPERPLPPELVERLSKPSTAKKILKRFSQKSGFRLRNVDERFVNADGSINEKFTRVRGIRLASYPELEVVIKRAHLIRGDGSELPNAAEITIAEINRRVDEHNRLSRSSENYRLLKPNAYAISEKLIAMAKTDKPTLSEITGHASDGRIYPEFKKEKGLKFFEKLKEEHGVTEKQLIEAVELIVKRTTPHPDIAKRATLYPDPLYPSHLLLLGVEKIFGKPKFIIMPLPDVC